MNVFGGWKGWGATVPTGVGCYFVHMHYSVSKITALKEEI